MRLYSKLLIAALLCGSISANAQNYGQPGGGGGGGGSGTVTSIATGCQATGGTITTTGTISTQITVTDVTGSNPAITTGYCGGQENLDNSSAQAPSIAEAGTTGFPAGWYTDLCNVNTGAQTITPAAGTIGGASTYVLAAGTAAAPKCVRITSDGVSNYVLAFPPSSGGGSGNALFGTTTGNTSGDCVTMANTTVGVQDSGVLCSSLAPLASPTFTGTPAAPTPGTNINTTQIPTTAWVNTFYAPLASPTFTGTAGAAAITATGVITDSLSPTTSQSAVLLSGAPQTGGNATTNFPLLYLNDGSGPTSFSTGGTEIGVNAPTGFAGNFIDFHLNGGGSLFSVSQTGVTTSATMATATITATGSLLTLSGANGPADAVTVQTRNVTSGSTAPGTITITAGSATTAGTANGGSITMNLGTSFGGTGGSLTINNLPTATGSYVCSSSGVISVEATACPASTLAAKNPIGKLNPFVAAFRLAWLSVSRFTYKDTKVYGEGEHVGLYAQDVEKMDYRCVTKDANGVIQNYDPSCMTAYLVADQNFIKILLMLLFVVHCGGAIWIFKRRVR